MLAGTDFTDDFTLERPKLEVEEPVGYVETDNLNPPIDPTDSQSQAILDAFDYVETYQDKIDVRADLKALGTDFSKHKGLLTWYIEELSQGQNLDPGQADISTVIVSFKNNYDAIAADINDSELEEKLYLAQMSIRSYDVFTLWLECTMDNMANIPLDEIPLSANRCSDIDPADVTSYDFTSSALSIVSTLFEGESVSWIITQYKYDYEEGLFETHFSEFNEVQEILVSTKELVDEYDEYYKDIATSIEGDISMLLKIGISVLKYNLDIYDTLENTPLLAAMFNDAARFCGSPDRVVGYDVEICEGSGDNSGFLGDFLNMRYLVSEVYLKAYFMVDENNERITYDSETMLAFLDDVNQSIEDNVITKEVVTAIADQLAFHVIDDTNGTTLLDQLYEEGYISIEAMRIMADDEYELFSDDFRARVRSLIR